MLLSTKTSHTPIVCKRIFTIDREFYSRYLSYYQQYEVNKNPDKWLGKVKNLPRFLIAETYKGFMLINDVVNLVASPTCYLLITIYGEDDEIKYQTRESTFIIGEDINLSEIADYYVVIEERSAITEL